MMIKPWNIINKLINGEAVTIVALGDSLTAGWMVCKGYIDFLREELTQTYPQAKLKVINDGLSGDTTNYCRYRLRSNILDLHPHSVWS